MRPNVQAQWNQRATPAQLALFADQVRRAVNQVPRYRALFPTKATGVATTIWQSEDLAPLEQARVVALVCGTNATGTVFARYLLEGLFYRPASGAAIQQGTTITMQMESDAALNATLGLSGNSIVVQVNDGALASMFWTTWVEVFI